MKTTGDYRVYIGIIGYVLYFYGLHRGHIGITEKNTETSRIGYIGFRVGVIGTMEKKLKLL